MMKVGKVKMKVANMFHTIELPPGSTLLKGSIKAGAGGTVEMHYLYLDFKSQFDSTKYAVCLLMEGQTDEVHVMADWYMGFAEVDGIDCHVFATYG